MRDVLRPNHDDPDPSVGGSAEHGGVNRVAVRLIRDQQAVCGVLNSETLTERFSRDVDTNRLPAPHHPEFDGGVAGLNECVEVPVRDDMT